MKKLVLFVFLLSACATPPPTLSQTEIQGTAFIQAWTAIVAAYTPTPANTAAPANTNTPEATATITNTPEPTADPLYRQRHDGIYLVGIDIAPGVWRNNGTGDSCYWKVSTATGDIIDNHYGLAGGTAYIPADGFQVEFLKCGVWEFLSAP